MRRFFRQAFLVMAGMSVGCSGPTEPTPITLIQVTTPSATVASGGTVQLSVATLRQDGKALSGRTVTWASSNEAVATVSATGLVTAGRVLGGASAITITTGTKTAAT